MTPTRSASTTCARQRRRSSAPSHSRATAMAQSQQHIRSLTIVLSTQRAVWQHPLHLPFWQLGLAAKLGQELDLAVGACGHLYVATEHAAGGEQVLLGLDDLEAGLDQVSREVRVLAR